MGNWPIDQELLSLKPVATLVWKKKNTGETKQYLAKTDIQQGSMTTRLSAQISRERSEIRICCLRQMKERRKL